MVDFVVCNSTSLTDRLCCTVYGTVVSSSNSASVDESHRSGKFNLWEYNIPNSPANESCSIVRPVGGIRARIVDPPVYLAVFDLSINVLPFFCPVQYI